VKYSIPTLRAVAEDQPGLRLLLLHGSRARGDTHDGSDWDFAYLADNGFDPAAMLAQLAEILHADRIDLADLSRASGLLRYRAAADGIVIFERKMGEFERYWLVVVPAWCDMEPVLRPAYDALLKGLR